jgi:hypothetical protein
MGSYFFFRYGMVSFAFVGWLLYQRGVKRKPWKDLKGDAIAILFFIAVWIGISYWVMS